jgi:DNA-binding CsgD family transcriptional regulator
VKDGTVTLIILIVQLVCAFFFISDILLGVVGLRTQPVSWQMRELTEIGAALGLGLGVVLGAMALRRALHRQKHAEGQLRLASGAFMDLLEERFVRWGLTPSESDVALFAIKGLSTLEISNLRKTSEGTVKAQTNAIYRKAGVSGRPQLLSLFIDDLMDDGLVQDVQKNLTK